MDIRNRDMSKPLTFRMLWIKTEFERLRRAFTPEEYSNEFLKEYLLKKYEEKYNPKGRFYNNTTSENQVMTLEQFTNIYLNNPYILSGYACLYKNQHDSINIGAAALEFLLSSRKKYKKKMEAAEHGSDSYIYYRILQLTYKVLANSYYGILGEKNSVFYNSFVQNSITLTGQDIITNSIVMLESFLSNNVPFFDTDDMINFVNNVCNEKSEHNILAYLDEPVTKQELIDYFNSHCEFGKSLDQDILKKIVENLTDEQVAKCFYKNRILELIKNSYFEDALRKMSFSKYEDNVPEEIRDDLENFKALVIEFCYLDHLVEDRYRRAVKNLRQSIITIDTDSNFINIHRYIVTTMTRLGYSLDDQEKDTTIMNIFVNVVTEILGKMFWTMTTNLGIPDTHKEIINMKSEFVYKRILLTSNKKNYAGIITSELGKPLSKPSLDIKGLSIKKTTVPKKLRTAFTKVLKEDILQPKEIDLKNIINKYDGLGFDIEKSLQNGYVEYLLPKNVELTSSYKTPDEIEPVRGTIIWNALEPEDTIVPPEKINLLKLDARKSDCIANVHDLKILQYLSRKDYQGAMINCIEPEYHCADPLDAIRAKFANILTEEALTLMIEHPDKYKAIAETVFNIGKTPTIDISRFGLASIAIPKGNDSIPDYLRPFIDYSTMINNNMTNGYILLKSLGIHCPDVQTTTYKSNIVSI